MQFLKDGVETVNWLSVKHSAINLSYQKLLKTICVFKTSLLFSAKRISHIGNGTI